MKQTELDELLGKLTLEEKIGMIHGSGLFHTQGVDRLGIPPLYTSDGPMGCRMEYDDKKWFPIAYSNDYTSYLPSNTALAATWNPTLAYETGKVLGKEARGRGKDMILAPGINVQRSPLCGRNFEYMGEDPYLISQMVVPLIKGIEEQDVSACVKHFAVNNQETKRLEVDVEVDERALREIYFPGFEAAVKEAKVKSIMGAYNKLRGQFCCHNDYLLNKVLREEWGFEGITISDWGGVHDTKEAAYHGLDIEMSVTDDFDEYFMAQPLLEKVQSGEIKEEVIDEKIRHILYVMNELHMLDGERKAGAYNDFKDREQLLQVALESIVLLKNQDQILPIKREKNKTILVVGDNANRRQAPGGGSAEIKALYEVTPLLGITMAAGGNMKVLYEPGYDANTSGNIWDNPDAQSEAGQATSLQDTGKKVVIEKDPEVVKARNLLLKTRAIEAAKKADMVIYVGGLNHIQDTEGQDRENMKLPYDQEALISDLLDANENTVLAMVAGSPVDMTAFEKKAKAIVYSWYAGMEGGTALGKVLFGDFNPCGKLPETFPKSEQDCSAHNIGEFPGDDVVRYKEGIFVGYRYYDSYDVEVQYPFGFGLSYTTFALSNLSLKEMHTQDDKKTFEITLQVENTGNQTGAETVQLYVGAKSKEIERAKKELKAFQKVTLEPGEKKEVTLNISKEAFRYYNVSTMQFEVEDGDYEIMVGTSVNNIMLTDIVQIKG